jgi:conjugative transposon TraM protein
MKNKKLLMYHGFCAVLCLLGCAFFYITGGGSQQVQAQDNETVDINVIPDPLVEDNNIQEKTKMQLFEEYQRELERKEAEDQAQRDFNSLSFFQGETFNENETEEDTIEPAETPSLTKEKEIEALNQIGSDKSKATKNTMSRPYERENKSLVTSSYEEKEETESVEEKIQRQKKAAMAKKRKRISEQTGIDITEKEDIQEKKVITVAASPSTEKKNDQKKTKGFKPMGGKGTNGSSPSIRAVIHGEQKDITTASQVKIRLLDNVNVAGVSIPRNTMVYAKASFSANRILLNIESIAYNDNVYPFDAQIFDVDGFEGLYIPDNAVNDAGKETTSNTLSGEGVGITTTQRTLSKIITTTSSAVKSAASNKIRETKVTLPANYKIIIKQKK